MSTNLTIGLTLLILFILLLSVTVFLVFLLRQRRLQFPFNSSSNQKNHLVFEKPSGIPRFTHNPGQHMRIATRRVDGAWDFGDPRAPFTPIGVWDLENVPFPSPSSARYSPSPPTTSSSPTSSYFGYIGAVKRGSSPLSILSSEYYGTDSEKEKRESSFKTGFDESESLSVEFLLTPPAVYLGYSHAYPYSPKSA